MGKNVYNVLNNKMTIKVVRLVRWCELVSLCGRRSSRALQSPQRLGTLYIHTVIMRFKRHLISVCPNLHFHACTHTLVTLKKGIPWSRVVELNQVARPAVLIIFLFDTKNQSGSFRFGFNFQLSVQKDAGESAFGHHWIDIQPIRKTTNVTWEHVAVKTFTCTS